MPACEKTRLIAFPGQLDGVFFKNELPYLRSVFDEVVIFSYPGDKKELDSLASLYNFSYHIVPTFQIKAFFQALRQILLDKEVRREAKGKSLQQIAYILLYLTWSNVVEDVYRKSLHDDVRTVLYSFWLSRGAYAACNLKRKFGLQKAVSRAHRYDLYEERNPTHYLPFRSLLSDSLDEIHFISDDGLKYFEERWGDGSARLFVSHLGTKFVSFRKSTRPKEGICVASCSAIIEVKRLDLIIDVLSEVGFPVFWLHVGDGELREKMEEYASQKLRSGSFEFVGRVDNRDIPSVFEQYDVDFFINLSDSEGIPVSIMEAMSMGIPAIARNVGGNAEIVNGKSGGLLLEDVNSGEIGEFLRNREQLDAYKALSDLSIEAWRSGFSADDNYPRFFEDLAG